MMGVEIFRPMRDLRTVLHQGMVGLSAAQGIYRKFWMHIRPSLKKVTLSNPSTPNPRYLSNRGASATPNNNTVFRQLDLSIVPGERVGVVGASGCGKSTIVRLLLRFYDPDQGTVKLGGHDIKDLSLAALRQQISVVNQDTFLFHGSIGENIRLGRPDATDAEVTNAAKSANIHEFVSGLPQAYDSLIGEKGIKLSGGQRKRVAFARALQRDSRFCFLEKRCLQSMPKMRLSSSRPWTG
ncbi:MAG: hypothetical protein CM1200mP18_21430 [Gammaproteobacteria bacterium]|nr:MAG: hypothetical protein CM1200mP18_21430 [Gammaproteobacteria bacterium]